MRFSQTNENSPRAENREPKTAPRAKAAHNSIAAFPKAARLLSKKHYSRVLRAGTKLVGESIVIDYRLVGTMSKSMDGTLRPRLGITVTRKYGKACKRNYFKRLVREAFRHYSPLFPKDLEINVGPRFSLQKTVKKTSKACILKDLGSLIDKITHVQTP